SAWSMSFRSLDTPLHLSSPSMAASILQTFWMLFTWSLNDSAWQGRHTFLTRHLGLSPVPSKGPRLILPGSWNPRLVAVFMASVPCLWSYVTLPKLILSKLEFD